MSARASWVLSPTDGKAHLLALNGATGMMITTHCRQSLPSGIRQYGRLPSGQLCRECVAAYLLPAPVFARMLTPAGRRSSGPVRSPGGQPVPPGSPVEAKCGCPAPVLPRWARCPTDHQLHLLTHAEAGAAGMTGHGRAFCGRRIPAAGLGLPANGGQSAGFCLAYVAEGTER